MIRLVVALATAFSGFIISLDASSLEQRGWWVPPAGLVFACMALVAGAVLWQFVDAEIERRRVKRRTELANEINKLMFPVWYKIRSVGANRPTRERIGVHVWMVPTWHWHMVPELARSFVPRSWRSRLPTPRMWRACHYRLKDDQHDSTDIHWTRDIGAIGRCWRDRERTVFDMRDRWGSTELFEAQWRNLPAQDKLGLTYRQYQRVHAKYSSVLVFPIFKVPGSPDTRFIGCVVVDALSTHPVNLNVEKVLGEAYSASKQIAFRVVPIAS